MGRPLTARQRRVLTFLREFVLSRSFAPTAREVADRFGIAEKNAFYYMELLERKGYIRRARKSPRRIEFLGEAALPVPLRVKGDSMEEAHICEGDYVLVRSQETAEDGEIVAAVVDGEATVKRIRRRNGGIRLEPANPAYAPLDVPNESPSFRIAGKVVGVFRKL